MNQRRKLSGVFPILNTTFHEDGSLDLESQAGWSRHLLIRAPTGSVCSEASEGYTLSDEER